LTLDRFETHVQWKTHKRCHHMDLSQTYCWFLADWSFDACHVAAAALFGWGCRTRARGSSGVTAGSIFPLRWQISQSRCSGNGLNFLVRTIRAQAVRRRAF